MKRQFFNNSLKEILKNEEEELTTEDKVFGKPEKELIKSLLAEIEIARLLFGRICGVRL